MVKCMVSASKTKAGKTHRGGGAELGSGKRQDLDRGQGERAEDKQLRPREAQIRVPATG